MTPDDSQLIVTSAGDSGGSAGLANALPANYDYFFSGIGALKVASGSGNDTFDLGPVTVDGTVTHTYRGVGPETIGVALTDRDGAHLDAGQQSLQVLADSPPVANAGGPYVVTEGGSVQLAATGSMDLDQPSSTLSYAWDFQGNGQFSDTTGAMPIFSAADLEGPGQVTVSVRVTDADGESSVASAIITIENVAPTAVLSSNGPVNAGSPETLSFTGASDPSALETAAGFLLRRRPERARDHRAHFRQG